MPASQFTLAQATQIVKDLFQPNPVIYWLDFAVHVTLGWAAFVLSLLLPDSSLWQLSTFLVSCLAL
jgi:hypothetical protein